MKNGNGLWAHTVIDLLLLYFYLKGGEIMANEMYYAGDGKPLDDDRLTLSGTTEAGEQQYRIWHDGQQILVPKGQSTTLKAQSENVQANTSVFGPIRKGYFQGPIVEFRNTFDYRLFDRFRFAIYREEFPTDPDIDLETLGFHLLDMQFTLVIDWYTYHWEIPKSVTMIKVGENQFQTVDAYQITTYTPYSTQGTLEYNMEISTFFNIGISETHDLGVLPFGNHILSMGLQNLRINRGSSEYLYNPRFNPTLPEIAFSAINIKLLRGWG